MLQVHLTLEDWWRLITFRPLFHFQFKQEGNRRVHKQKIELTGQVCLFDNYVIVVLT